MFKQQRGVLPRSNYTVALFFFVLRNSSKTFFLKLTTTKNLKDFGWKRINKNGCQIAEWPMTVADLRTPKNLCPPPFPIFFSGCRHFVFSFIVLANTKSNIKSRRKFFFFDQITMFLGRQVNPGERERAIEDLEKMKAFKKNV